MTLFDWHYPKYVSGSIQVLIWANIEGKLDHLKNLLQVEGAYESLAMLEAKIRKGSFF